MHSNASSKYQIANENNTKRKKNQTVYIIVGVVVVVLTLTRLIKSVVTGQAPGTLELRKTPGKKTQTEGGTRIYTVGTIHACARKKYMLNSGVSVRCARSILVHRSHFSRLEKPTIPFSTQKRLSRK